jgi:esterase/lipase
MKNLLYIYGFNSSAKTSTSARTFKTELVNFNVYTPEYPQEDGEKAYKFLQKYIDENDIDIVVGTSLGGFLALCLKCDYKIIINPACDAGDDIIKIGASIEQMTSYNKIRDLYLWKQHPKKQIALFGKYDNLVNYKSEYIKKYGANDVYDINTEHHLSKEDINNYVFPYVRKFFEKQYNMKSLTKYVKESLMINERFVTPIKKDDMKKWASQVWKLLNDAYKYCGGLKGMNSIEQLIKETDIWKIVRRGDKVTAVVTYSTKRGGRKNCYMASSQDEQGKHDLFMIMKEDAKLLDREAWCEASGKTVSVKLKNGWTPIPNYIAQYIMKDKKFDELCKDGFFYVRQIGNHKFHKIMLGNYGGKHHMNVDEKLINTLKELSKKYFAIDEE